MILLTTLLLQIIASLYQVRDQNGSILKEIIYTFENCIFSSSKQNKIKWSNKQENKYSLRSETNHDQKIPEKPIPKCTGFSYTGAKLFNKLPCDMKESTNSNTFKLLAKAWIRKNIPAY